MSSFLGYDPGGIDVLRQAMRRTVDSLGAIRCDDRAAADARAVIAAAISTIGERWLRLLDDLAMCRPLDEYTGRVFAADDLTTSMFSMLHERHGWRIQTDPLPMPTLAWNPWFGEHTARAIGWRLSNTDDIGALLSGDEVAWLARAIEAVAADPDLTAAFAAEMTPGAWRGLCDALAREQLWRRDPVFASVLTAEDRAYSASVDRVLVSLGSVVAATDRAVLDTMAPYSAALVLRHTGLAGEELADVTARLLRRWLDERDPQWPDVEFDGLNAGDVLIDGLLADRAARAAYLSHATAEPALLFLPAADPGRAEALALAMTRPGAAPDAEIGAAVVAWSRYLLDGGDAADFLDVPYGIDEAFPAYRAMLGELAAPWLLQFTDWHRHDWGFAEGEGEALLGRILADDDAFARFGDARPSALEAFGAALARDPDGAVDDLGAVSGLLDRVTADRFLADAEHARAVWDLKVEIAGAGLTFVAGRLGALVSPMGGKVAKKITGRVGVPLLERFARDRGWDWIPPTEAESEAAVAAALSWSHTLLVAAVAATVFDELVKSGRVAPGTPPPPAPVAGESTLDYRHHLEQWRARLPGDVQGDAGLYRDVISTYDPHRNR